MNLDYFLLSVRFVVEIRRGLSREIVCLLSTVVALLLNRCNDQSHTKCPVFYSQCTELCLIMMCT